MGLGAPEVPGEPLGPWGRALVGGFAGLTALEGFTGFTGFTAGIAGS